MRIALAGSGRLATNLLESVRTSKHEVVAIIQDGRQTRGLGQKIWPWLTRILGGRRSMMGWAKRLGIPIIWLDRMDESELASLRRLAPDLLLVGGFAIILKPSVLSLPRVGCVNCHSSLLPRHRGPNPFAAVILAGDAETGVTFHIMEASIDSGDILDQSRIAVPDDATMMSLYTATCDLAADRVVAVLDRIERDGLHGTPQDPALATYEKRITRDDAWIDWSRPAVDIDRLVRAITPSPMPRTSFRGRPITVARTSYDPAPVNAEPGTILRTAPRVTVATGAGTVTLLVAFQSWPLPWLWPSLLSAPQLGDRLGGGARSAVSVRP